MISTSDPRRTLYEGARQVVGPDGAAALIEIITCGPDPEAQARERADLRRDLHLWERDVAARRALDRTMRQLRWVCILCPLVLWAAIGVKALLG